MSYNWQSADTPQGRERFMKLVDQGYEIATRRSAENIYKNVITHSGIDPHSYDIIIDNDRYEDWEDAEENDAFSNLEFLDTKPQPATVNENGLMPCPFCGGKAITAEHELLCIKFITNCQSCEAETSIFQTKEKAVEAWNKRA